MPERPPLPESISGCVLGQTLREGPAHVVVRARDSLGLPVDLHLFPAEMVMSRVPREVFFDEVRATAALHHERLAPVVNAGEKGPWLFVACKGTEGATLAHLLGRGHVDEERALGIFAAVAEGVAVLEAAGLRHGGLDPQAVGLPGAGQVLLSLRRLVPVDLDVRDPCYLSPEEARGQDWGVASDLFSIGLMLLEALHGRPALEGSAEEVKVALSRGAVPNPSSMLRGVLPQTVDLLASLLAADPRARPPSATETARRLRALQGAFSATESLEGSFDAPLAAVPLGAPAGWAPSAMPASPPAGIGGAPPIMAPVAAAAPEPPATPSIAPRRRAHARLIVPFRGVELIHELLEPATFLGPDETGRVVARPESFPGALARVEVGATSDYLVATGTGAPPRMHGQEVQHQELRFGDEFEVGGERILFEKAEKLLPEGAEGTEQERAHRVRPKAARAPVVAGTVLCLLVAAWGALRFAGARGSRVEEIQREQGLRGELEDRYRRLPALEAPLSGPERVVREESAFRALDSARAERAAGRDSRAKEKYQSLLKQYPDTGAALLAEEELRDVRGSGRLPGADELRAVQARADALVAEGKLAEAQETLLRFAGEHQGSFVGDRASQAASAVAKVSEDRVDELLRQARAAADRKDWQVALAAASRAVAAAATVDVRDRAGVEQKRIQGLMPKTATDGGVAPEPPAPPPGGAPPGGSPRDPGRPPAEPPAAKKPTASAHDDEATELFRASRKAMEAGRFGSAERGFYRLLAEYRDAKIVRDYEQEVLHRLDEAYEKGRGVAGLFEGSVHVKGSRVALTYTFDDPAEAKDWETVHPFQVPQKGKFTVAGGELAGEGAAAFQHRAAFRTDGVSMSFRILPGAPAQDMGAMMVEPKDPVNHLLFTIANEFFKLGKGKEAYAVPGNVIFVFGKGMWRSTDPGMAGFVKTAASEEPKVQPRKWAEIEVAKERDKARFTIEGKSLNGRAIGDNKYEITGVRPALFVLLSEARFDDVTVEGEPDPDWARAEHERLFPTLK